jgi:hypothetical protein
LGAHLTVVNNTHARAYILQETLSLNLVGDIADTLKEDGNFDASVVNVSFVEARRILN